MNGLHRLLWQGRRVFAYLGWAGLAGLILSAAAAAFYWRVQLPQEAALLSLADASAALRSRVAQRRAASQGDISPAAQLEQFYRFFPNAEGDALTEALGKIYAAASAENLTLDQGDYRLSPETVGHLVRYDITLPVKGSYPHLRRFLAAALKDVPTLALEGISFNRQAAADIGINAQLRLTLYLRGTEAAGS
ncbi:MAG: hypothetical protein EKK46_02640 [Rhodocyclaceae bacterium]|nr:MAG: hypothetical protein EKK46_02640 [Rhodocyclaceae bacterium]